jgi:threonine/homoserine/homoserine lactone efflux protein
MLGSFLAFLGASAIVIMTPGPDTALTIRNTLLGGRTGGVCAALGVSFGQIIWAFATSLGIVALLVASEPLFLAVKYAGAAYLVFLGGQALYAALRSSGKGNGAVFPRPARQRLSPLASLRQGIISDLGNPKMAVFFASLLPQFAAEPATFSSLMLLGLVFSLMTFCWLAAYATVVAKAGDVLMRPRIRRTIEGVTGAVLIALGLRIAAEQR